MRGAVISHLEAGGIASSKYSGQPNSVASLIGFDIHSNPGLLLVNQKLVKESSTVVVGLVKKILPCTDGLVYAFDDLGNIYTRSALGAWTLTATAAPAAGAVGIMDAYEFQGYIFYSMQNRMGRVAVGAPTSWAGRDDNWKTFTVGDALYHPFIENNVVLYCGDGYLVSQVDDTFTFVGNALDVSKIHRIKALGKQGTDLLIGTINSQNIAKASIFIWNTWSTSFNSEDEVDEVGINAFIASDNFSLVSAGINGQIYVLNGYQLEKFKKVPGSYSPTAYMNMHPNASAYFRDLPMFGISNGSGNPLNQGVYSFGATEAGLTKVLALEYPISERSASEYVLTGIEIGSIAVRGNDLWVSWKNGSTYGIDKLDYTVKLEKGILESRLLNVDRLTINRYKKWIATYEALPASTNIKMYYKNFIDFSLGYSGDIVMIKDAKRLLMQKELEVQASIMQCKVEVLSSGNNAPTVQEIYILFE